MTWPTAQTKVNFDAATDDPQQARSEFADNVDKFNLLQAHVSSFMQGLLDDANSTAARATLVAQKDVITTRGDFVRGDSAGAAERVALTTVVDSALVSNSTDLVYAPIIKQGTHAFYVPASAMVSRISNGAAEGTAQSTSNKVMIQTLDFDTSADEFGQFSLRMPQSWDAGTVTANFEWSHGTTATGGVAFFLQGVSLANDQTIDTAFGTAQGTTDAGGTTNDIYLTAETTTITIAGATKDELVVFQVYRDVSDAGDTLAVDARLHGLQIRYGIDAADDS